MGLSQFPVLPPRIMCITFVQVVFHNWKQNIGQELVHNNLEVDADTEMLIVWMCFVDKETMGPIYFF